MTNIRFLLSVLALCIALCLTLFLSGCSESVTAPSSNPASPLFHAEVLGNVNLHVKDWDVMDGHAVFNRHSEGLDLELRIRASRETSDGREQKVSFTVTVPVDPQNEYPTIGQYRYSGIEPIRYPGSMEVTQQTQEPWVELIERYSMQHSAVKIEHVSDNDISGKFTAGAVLILRAKRIADGVIEIPASGEVRISGAFRLEAYPQSAP